jgi:hypothetical protein
MPVDGEIASTVHQTDEMIQFQACARWASRAKVFSGELSGRLPLDAGLGVACLAACWGDGILKLAYPSLF